MNNNGLLKEEDSSMDINQKEKRHMSVNEYEQQSVTYNDDDSIFQRNTFLRQTRAMMKKNIVLQKRFIVGTICECLFPIILILLSCLYVLMFKDTLDVDKTSYSKQKTHEYTFTCIYDFISQLSI